MAKPTSIIGLDDFGLTTATITKLGARPVSLSIQLTGRTASALRHLRPKQRIVTLRQALANQLERLRRQFPDVDFRPRGNNHPSWTIDAVVPARRVRDLASSAQVKFLMLRTVEGRRQRPSGSGPGWFCVWGIIAVQIEGRVTGSLCLEDRLVLMKAHGPKDAQRQFQRMCSRNTEPYLNSDGYLVRWQLISIRDVYALLDQAVDPEGTEVYSKLRTARMRPEYRWRSEKKARVTQGSQ